MTETTPPEFNEIPEPTEPTGAPIPEPVPSPILEFVTAMTEVDPATAFSTSPTMEQEVAAAMTLMPETTAVGLASEPEVDFPESVIAPTLPTVQVLLRGANTNHFMTVLNVERNPDGSLMVEVRHTTA